MATLDEYKAVHGGEPPAGKTAATELGDGGCFAIYTGKHHAEVLGRWSDYTVASDALVKLQLHNGRFEYLLRPSHHWVTHGTQTTCQTCGAPRSIGPTLHRPYNHEEWPS